LACRCVGARRRQALRLPADGGWCDFCHTVPKSVVRPKDHARNYRAGKGCGVFSAGRDKHARYGVVASGAGWREFRDQVCIIHTDGRVLGQSRAGRLGRDPKFGDVGERNLTARGPYPTNNRMELMAAISGAGGRLQKSVYVDLYTRQPVRAAAAPHRLDHMGWKEERAATPHGQEAGLRTSICGRRGGGRMRSYTRHQVRCVCTG